MKNLLLILFVVIIVIGCNNENNPQKIIAGDNQKCWSLLSHEGWREVGDKSIDISNSGDLGYWCFSADNSIHKYQVNGKENLELSHDQEFTNAWHITNDSSIVIRDTPYKIVKMSQDSLVIKTEYNAHEYDKLTFAKKE